MIVSVLEELQTGDSTRIGEINEAPWTPYVVGAKRKGEFNFSWRNVLNRVLFFLWRMKSELEVVNTF